MDTIDRFQLWYKNCSIEKYKPHKKHFVFIDLEKAFERIPRKLTFIYLFTDLLLVTQQAQLVPKQSILILYDISHVAFSNRVNDCQKKVPKTNIKLHVFLTQF